jgi:hypothetical protein
MPSSVGSSTPEVATSLAQGVAAATEGESQSDHQMAGEAVRGPRVNLVQRVRDWLRRAA